MGVFIFFKIDRLLKNGVLSVGDEIKQGVMDVSAWSKETYHRYFNQAETIKELTQKVAKLEALELEKIELQNQIQELLIFDAMPKVSLAGISPIQAISYVDFGNYHRIWLSEYESQTEGFYGLVSGGYVAGIATKVEGGRMIGYLNGDDLCSYGVFIGKNKSPGIIKNSQGLLVADFVPLESEIEIGDEVITNGLDEIFFANIPVGRVKKIDKNSQFMSVEIEPYVQKTKLGYMWLLDRHHTKEETK